MASPTPPFLPITDADYQDGFDVIDTDPNSGVAPLIESRWYCATDAAAARLLLHFQTLSGPGLRPIHPVLTRDHPFVGDWGGGPFKQVAPPADSDGKVAYLDFTYTDGTTTHENAGQILRDYQQTNPKLKDWLACNSPNYYQNAI